MAIRLSYLTKQQAYALAKSAKQYAKNMADIAERYRHTPLSSSKQEGLEFGDKFDAEISRYLRELDDGFEEE